MLNSFWGKFGQRNNLSQTEYVTDPDKFFAKMDDVKTNVSSVQFFGDSMACMTYNIQDEFLQPLNNSNPVIAAFVTTQARLKLYSYLEKLKERVLYFDTGNINIILSCNKTFKFNFSRFYHLPDPAD